MIEEIREKFDEPRKVKVVAKDNHEEYPEDVFAVVDTMKTYYTVDLTELYGELKTEEQKLKKFHEHIYDFYSRRNLKVEKMVSYKKGVMVTSYRPYDD